MKDYIIEKAKELDIPLGNEGSFKKNFPDEYIEISNTHYPEGFSFPQKVYHYIHEDTRLSLGLCPVCGNRCGFRNTTKGYRGHCSRECAKNDPVMSEKISVAAKNRSEDERGAIKRKKLDWYSSLSVDEKTAMKEKRKKTNRERYGVEYASQSAYVKEKTKETNRERYGADYYSQTDECKEHVKQTSLEHYGVENPHQSEEVKEKFRKTVLERYGVENPAQSEPFKEKSRQTNLKRYGVEIPSQSDAVKEKTKRTCLEKYGVENPHQSGEVKEKFRQTVLERYGVENPAQSELSKEKSRQTNLERYGTEIPQQLDIVKEKTKQTNLERYGVEYTMQSDDVKEKARRTNMEKYGVEHVMQSGVFKEKAVLTTLERYGKEHYTQTEEYRERAASTNMERYGDSCYYRTEDFREKARKTNLERYGDEIPQRTDAIKEKTRESCVAIYGVDNPSKSDAVKRKKSETAYGHFGVQHVFCSDIVKEKMRKARNGKTMRDHPFIMDIDGNGNWICRCPNPECSLCDEKFYVTTHTMYNDRKRFGINTCTRIKPKENLSSVSEIEFLQYIDNIYEGAVLNNDRKVLGGKELDVYIPDRKLAFEYNGVYWHGEQYKDKDYHMEKSVACLGKGIHLVHVWEDDWLYKTDIVKNLIRGELGLHENKINARDCEVGSVGFKEAREFCNTYHIQGYTTAKVSAGLYHNGGLVMVCLLGPRRRISGGFPVEGEWELYRMCSVFDTRVRGGASKLLKWFVKNYSPEKVTTFADLGVSDGGVYEKMGFKRECFVDPTYYWVVDNVRRPRYMFQKSNLHECKENPNLTEVEIMHARGCYRCWDAGKIKYSIVFG